MSNVISGFYQSKKAAIVRELLARYKSMNYVSIGAGDIYTVTTHVLSGAYVRNDINDFDIEVGFKDPSDKTQGYSIDVSIQHTTGQYDNFILFFDYYGSGEANNSKPVDDPIKAYERAMGIL